MFDITQEKNAVIFENRQYDLLLIVFSYDYIVSVHKGKLQKHHSYKGVLFFLTEFPKAVRIAFELNWQYLAFD